MDWKNVFVVGGIALLAIFVLALIYPRALAFLLTGGRTAAKAEA